MGLRAIEWLPVLTLGLAPLACGGSEVDETGTGGGAPSAGCQPAERSDPNGNGCILPGIAPELCAPGFESDGAQSCVAILPAAPCTPGSMAIPGESECRPVAPCPAGPWPDAPLDGTTQYVDQSYGGGASNGSEASPWTTIAEAVNAASADAIIAVTDGTYSEELAVSVKSVRIWGRCPETVAIAAPATAQAAVLVRTGPATGTELRDLAITGGGIGVIVSGSRSVALDRVWIHDTGFRGVVAQDDLGETEVTLTRSLVESTTELGLSFVGIAGTLSESVVRNTQPLSGNSGRGIGALDSEPTGQPSSLVISNSVIEGNREFGIFLGGSLAVIDATVVRDTLPMVADQGAGRGIDAQASPLNGQRADLTLRTSVVERNHEVGVVLHGSDAFIESTVVRDTLPRATDGTLGFGFSAEQDMMSQHRAALTLRHCVAERNSDVGISVIGSDADMESVISRMTQAVAGDVGGRGMNVQVQPITHEPAQASLRWSLIADNVEAGITVFGATATLESVYVHHTASHATGEFGDGLAVISFLTPTSASVTDSTIEASARAGILNVGASVSLGASSLQCNPVHLDGESNSMGDAAFDDAGDNVCGCSDETEACKVLSQNLQPPVPI